MAKTNLDAIDRKILKFLIKNARTPFLEIARECGISGVILGSRLLVDPRTLGFDVCAYIGIRLESPKELGQTLEALKKIPEIVECHFITGSYSLFAKLYCLDNDHLMKVIESLQNIPGISSTQTYISLKEAFQRQVYVDCLKD